MVTDRHKILALIACCQEKECPFTLRLLKSLFPIRYESMRVQLHCMMNNGYIHHSGTRRKYVYNLTPIGVRFLALLNVSSFHLQQKEGSSPLKKAAFYLSNVTTEALGLCPHRGQLRRLLNALSDIRRPQYLHRSMIEPPF